MITIFLFIVSAIVFITTYQQKKARGETYCDIGSISKDDNSPFGYSGNNIITEIGIKAGTECIVFTKPGSNGCYTVTGIGTNSVSAIKIGSGSSCKDISHVAFFSKAGATTIPTQPQSPTPTLMPSLIMTPTNTTTPIPTTITTTTITNPVLSISPTIRISLSPSASPSTSTTPRTSTTISVTQSPSTTTTITPSPSLSTSNQSSTSPTTDSLSSDSLSATPLTTLPRTGDLRSIFAIAVPVLLVFAGMIF